MRYLSNDKYPTAKYCLAEVNNSFFIGVSLVRRDTTFNWANLFAQTNLVSLTSSATEVEFYFILYYNF